MSFRCGFMHIVIILTLGGWAHTVSAGSQDISSTKIRREIPAGEDKLVLASDQMEDVSTTQFRASGNVVITLLDMTVTCDEAEYDAGTSRIITRASSSSISNDSRVGVAVRASTLSQQRTSIC